MAFAVVLTVACPFASVAARPAESVTEGPDAGAVNVTGAPLMEVAEAIFDRGK
jgi:hypothetical protein